MERARAEGPETQGTPVLIVVQNQGVPPDVRILEFGRTLASAGYAVDVIAPRRGGQPLDEWVDGMRVHRFAEPPEARGAAGYAREIAVSLSRIWAARRRVRHPGRGILHIANPPDLLWVPFLPYLNRMVLVYDQHDLVPELYLAKGGVRTSPLYLALLGMERVAYALADVVIAPNQSYRQIAHTRGGVDLDRIHVVRNAPDEGVWYAARDGAPRRADGLVKLCYIGATGTQDGMDQLLRGLARARQQAPERTFRLSVAGTGDGLEEAKRMAGELGLAGSVEFLGWIADQASLRELVASADIAIEPCPSNPFNDASTMVKLMNYLAVGCPTVAFDLPENRSTAGEAALLVDPRSGAEGLGDAIAKLADDVRERARLSGAARRRLSTAHLTASDARRALLAAYDAARRQSAAPLQRW